MVAGRGGREVGAKVQQRNRYIFRDVAFLQSTVSAVVVAVWLVSLAAFQFQFCVACMCVCVTVSATVCDSMCV